MNNIKTINFIDFVNWISEAKVIKKRQNKSH